MNKEMILAQLMDTSQGAAFEGTLAAIAAQAPTAHTMSCGLHDLLTHGLYDPVTHG